MTGPFQRPDCLCAIIRANMSEVRLGHGAVVRTNRAQYSLACAHSAKQRAL